MGTWRRRGWGWTIGVVWIVMLAPGWGSAVRAAEDGAVEPAPQEGADLYRNACAACHGLDGAGGAPSVLGFEEEIPDFNDCSFASREPDGDWFGVAHSGGPIRGFSEMMPALGDAVSKEELDRILEHIRGFCGERQWPSGNLNQPKGLHTEKAFPEDEAYVRVGSTVEGPVEVDAKIVVEKRFGPMGQVEFVLPFGIHQGALTESGERDATTFGVADIAVGIKHALFHSKRSGSIVALAAEIKLPTGNEATGYGKGTVVAEPFLSYSQDLFAVGFLHAQAGAELAFLPRKADPEVFWRLTYGRSFEQRHFGRTWTPMVEVLGKAEFGEETETLWDIVPQLQVTLNVRQHVMLNAGVRVPLNHTDERPVAVLVYLLWDWFDGGFFQGW